MRQALLALNSPEACAVFAARCVLRGLPHIIYESTGVWRYRGTPEKAPEHHALGVVAAALVGLCEYFPNMTSVAVACAAAARAAAPVAIETPADEPGSVANGAACVADAVAAGNAKETAAAAYLAAIHMESWVSDADLEIARVGAGKLARSPLWDGEHAKELYARWAVLLNTLPLRVCKLLEGIRDNNPDFAAISEWLKTWYAQQQPVASMKVRTDSASMSGYASGGSPGLASSAQKNRASPSINNAKMEAPTAIDRLERGHITTALYQLLTNRQDTRHFALGLFGAWGEGKTSLIEQLKEKLREFNKNAKRPFVLAEFNAWENEKAESVGAMMAQAVVESLVDELGFFAKLKYAIFLKMRRNENLIKSIKRDCKIVLRYFFAILPVVIALCFVCYQSGFYLSLQKPVWPVVLGVLSLAYGSVVFSNNTLMSFFKQIGMDKPLLLFKVPDYGEHRGLLGDIRRNLEYMCDLILTESGNATEGRSLLLVIDDLDRCSVRGLRYCSPRYRYSTGCNAGLY